MSNSNRCVKAETATEAWRSRHRHDLEFREAISMGDLSCEVGPLVDLRGYLRVTNQGVVDPTGHGVKAVREFPEGVYIITGRGRVREAGTYDDDSMSYSMDGAGVRYSGLDLDMSGGRGETNLVKYINSVQGTGRVPNCLICYAGAQLLVMATCDIRAGDELLADYSYLPPN